MIVTHCDVDLDALASIWAAKKYIIKEDCPIEFVTANWKGTSDVLGVDLKNALYPAQDEFGKYRSCFTLILKKYAPPTHQRSLGFLADYVDAATLHGNPMTNLLRRNKLTHGMAVLSANGLDSIIKNIRLATKSDHQTYDVAETIFDGFLASGLSYQKALETSKDVDWCGEVAIITNGEKSANTLAFKNGAKAIVYIDGDSLGVICRNDIQVSAMNEWTQRVVDEEEYSNQMNGWYSHPNGKIYCRGSRKAPVNTPSDVNPVDLAEAMNKALKEE